MANSAIISRLKDKVITEIINDETLFYAIDSPTIKKFEDADKLVGTHIFNYSQNPLTLEEVQTFLTICVSTRELNMTNNIWIVPRMEICIISHQSHMKVDNIPKITANRNDYISQLLDQKFNGRTEIGVSKNTKNNLNMYAKLNLTINGEGPVANDYLYRQMIFETKDLSNSMCGEADA